MEMKSERRCVEAIRVEDGFLIPFQEGLPDTSQDRIWLEVELVDPAASQNGYQALDQIVGLCESGQPDAALHHDSHIYKKRP